MDSRKSFTGVWDGCDSHHAAKAEADSTVSTFLRRPSLRMRAL